MKDYFRSYVASLASIFNVARAFVVKIYDRSQSIFTRSDSRGITEDLPSQTLIVSKSSCFCAG